MKLIGHLVAIDVRRFRWLLLLWLAIEVTGAAINVVQPALAVNVRLFNVVGVVGNLLWLAELILFAVFVPIVVQADPPIGTDAFWMTRPIPSVALLAAKGLLLWITLALVPIALEHIMMAAFRVPAVSALHVTAQSVLVQTLWIVVLIAAAAVTTTLARFVLLWGGIVLGLALVVSIVTLVEMRRAEAMVAAVSIAPFDVGADDPTSGLVGMVLATLALVAGISVQYLTRSRIRSVPVSIASVILSATIASYWPWPLIPVSESMPEWARRAATLQLSMDTTSAVADGTADFYVEPPRRSVRALVRLHEVPPHWSAEISLDGAELQLNDGRRLSSGRSYPANVRLGTDDESETDSVIRTLLDVEQLPSTTRYTLDPAVFSLTDAEFRQFERATGRYVGRFRVILHHHEVDGVIPLRRGAEYQRGAHRIIVDRVSTWRGAPSVLIRESDATSMFDVEPRSSQHYYLRNPARRQAMAATLVRPMVTETPIPRLLPFVIGFSTRGFGAGAKSLDFTHDRRPEVIPFRMDDSWLSGAEIVIVRTTYRGSVQRTLTMEQFVIPVEPASTSRQ